MASVTALVAHQGGWDEVLLVAGPVVVIIVALTLAKRRVDRLEQNGTGVGGNGDGGASGSGVGGNGDGGASGSGVGGNGDRGASGSGVGGNGDGVDVSGDHPTR